MVADRFAEARAAVLTGEALRSVAERLGIPESTLRRRAKAEGWRTAAAEAGRYTEHARELKHGLLKELLKLHREGKEVPEQKAFLWLKLEAQFPELRAQLAASTPLSMRDQAVAVMERFVSFLGDRDPSALAAVQETLRPFLESLADG